MIVSCNPKKNYNTFNEIGAGEYGKVYRACLGKECVAVKNSAENLTAEYAISQKLSKYAVPMTYGYQKCADRELMFSEFVNGLDLKKFIEKNVPTEKEIKSIVGQVLRALYAIHKKYPTFRHHDLHLGNVMVIKKDKESRFTLNENGTFNDAKLKVKLMDFGLSTVSGVTNPTVKASRRFKTDYGIFRGSHRMYDVHLFMTSLYAGLPKSPAFRAFVERHFAKEYLVKTSGVVREHRLAYEFDHAALPTYAALFGDRYFAKSVMNRILSRPKVQPKVPSPPKNRAKVTAVNFLRAMAAAKKEPKVLRRPALTRNATRPMSVRGSPKK